MKISTCIKPEICRNFHLHKYRTNNLDLKGTLRVVSLDLPFFNTPNVFFKVGWVTESMNPAVTDRCHSFLKQLNEKLQRKISAEQQQNTV